MGGRSNDFKYLEKFIDFFHKKEGYFMDDSMDVTQEEIEILFKIEDNQYTGGGYKRAAWIDKVCRNKTDRLILDNLCKKGLAETGLGGTVAGDTYRACWLTDSGKELVKKKDIYHPKKI